MALLKDPAMAKGLKEHLEEQARQGYEWVVYDTDTPINDQYDLVCFRDWYEAENEARDYQQILSWYMSVPISDLIYKLRELEISQLGSLAEPIIIQHRSKSEINNIDMDFKVNRAKQLWENWEHQEKQIERLAGITTDRNSLTYKYDFLSKGLYRLSSPREDEKLFMQAIKTVTAKLQKQLYPNPLLRMLHRLKVLMIDRPVHLAMFNRNKRENFQVLGDQLKAVGLQHFADHLQNRLDYESPVIELKSLSALDSDNRIEVSLNLEKSRLGHYEFNGYNIVLLNENVWMRNFNFSTESKITLTEAVNLLQDRAVYKSYETADGSRSQKWIQLNGLQGNGSAPQLLVYPPNYDFDLKQVLLENGTQLEFYTIANDSIKRGLEAGNRVEFQINGEGRYSITADPSSRKVNFFDAEKRPITINSLKKIIHPVRQPSKRKETNIIQQKEAQQDNQMKIVR